MLPGFLADPLGLLRPPLVIDAPYHAILEQGVDFYPSALVVRGDYLRLEGDLPESDGGFGAQEQYTL